MRKVINAFGMCGFLKDFALQGLVNIVGGCCGTTPAHIKAIAESISGIKPREPPQDLFPQYTRLAGISSLVAEIKHGS